jgi:hypothetical protein
MMASVVEHGTVGTQKSGGNEAFAWRCERYEELGFNAAQAVSLANSKVTSTTGGKDKSTKKVTWQTPLHWNKVKEALDKGCSHDLAIQIFVTE